MFQFAVVLTSLLLAESKPSSPADPMPSPLSDGTAKIDGDNLRCHINFLRYVTEQRTVTVIKDGRVVTETQTIKVPVLTTEVRLIPLKGIQAHVVGSNGGDPTKAVSPLDPTKLPKMIEDRKPIAFAPPGAKVTAELVKGRKEGTIVLVLPKPEPTPPPK